LARQDDEGFLWIEGRKGAFLKVRGTRLSFAEVEEKVAAIPGVYECAALAADHAEAGEALVLLIVPDQGARIGVEDVYRQLPAHWTLDSIHLVSELPKTSAGKIARSSLSVLGRELTCSNLMTK
jgi:acyl-coenzyme A synthetase/AMP-(fatty) acid ligase